MQNSECKMQKDNSSVADVAPGNVQKGLLPPQAVPLPQEGGLDVVAVIRCRDCKHGQQVGGYGVLCEYGLEELRPMDHFCAWGEVRSFEPEDNEEE